MTDNGFQQANDSDYAQQLRDLGKTTDCPCSIDFYYAELGNRKMMLRYDYSCPIHYPETSRVLTGNGGIAQEPKTPSDSLTIDEVLELLDTVQESITRQHRVIVPTLNLIEELTRLRRKLEHRKEENS